MGCVSAMKIVKDSSQLTQGGLWIGVVVAFVVTPFPASFGGARVGLGVPFKHSARKSRGGCSERDGDKGDYSETHDEIRKSAAGINNTLEGNTKGKLGTRPRKRGNALSVAPEYPRALIKRRKKRS